MGKPPKQYPQHPRLSRTRRVILLAFLVFVVSSLHTLGFSSSAKSVNGNPKFTLQLWTTDLHAAPIGCQINMFESMGVQVHAKIDFHNCRFFHTSRGSDLCAHSSGLKSFAYDGWKGFSLDPSPEEARQRFYEAYKGDKEFAKVEFVFCSHPASNCELYLPFNKSIIVYLSTRVEFGRDDEYIWWRKPFLGDRKARWKHWESNLRSIAARPFHLVAANNLYDVEYLYYMTGIIAEYIPSWCGMDLNRIRAQKFEPIRKEVILTPYRLNLEFSKEAIPTSGWPDIKSATFQTLDHPLFNDYHDLGSGSFKLLSMHDTFPGGHFQTIDQFREFKAAIFIPYQASTMFFFQLYRASVPILAPSPELLYKWVKRYRILWEVSYGKPERSNDWVTRFNSKLPDPNKFDAESRRPWLQFYDIYQEDVFPHILFFDSWKHADTMLSTTNFHTISRKMQRHNELEYSRIQKLWSDHFDKCSRARDHHIFPAVDQSGIDFKMALTQNGYASTIPHLT